MKRLKIGLVFLGFVLITGVFFAFYNKSFFAEGLNENQYDQVYFEEISKKVHEIDLNNQVITALKEKGYDLEETIGYQIHSSDKQFIVISLKNIEKKDKKVEKEIQGIVNTVAKANGLNPFIVDIQSN